MLWSSYLTFCHFGAIYCSPKRPKGSLLKFSTLQSTQWMSSWHGPHMPESVYLLSYSLPKWHQFFGSFFGSYIYQLLYYNFHTHNCLPALTATTLLCLTTKSCQMGTMIEMLLFPNGFNPIHVQIIRLGLQAGLLAFQNSNLNKSYVRFNSTGLDFCILQISSDGVQLAVLQRSVWTVAHGRFGRPGVCLDRLLSGGRPTRYSYYN